jgi:hypothetical protein
VVEGLSAFVIIDEGNGRLLEPGKLGVTFDNRRSIVLFHFLANLNSEHAGGGLSWRHRKYAIWERSKPALLFFPHRRPFTVQLTLS